MKSRQEILENSHYIDGIKLLGTFYWVNYFDEETETFYAFELDNDCKIDYEFTVDEIADNEKFVLYELKEM